MITPAPWAACPIPNDRLKRWAVVCINDEYCQGTGKAVIACDIRTEENARLIAAAPELLAALQGLLRSTIAMREQFSDADGPAVNALAVIAKATGSEK